MSNHRYDEQLLQERIQHLRESLEFFSNKMKPGRERWVCREFLRDLGVAYSDDEIVSIKDDPPDVVFRSGRFEVKEIQDSDRRRMDEFRELLARTEKATQFNGTLAQKGNPRTMPATEIGRIVSDQARSFLTRYPTQLRRSLDLLFYANFLDTAVTGETVGSDVDLPNTEWRSIAFTSNNCSCVLCAAEDAPLFLRDAVGRVIHRATRRL